MAIQIEGTQVRKRSGSGLGSLLGKIAGAAAVIGSGGTALPAVLGGASVGGMAGGLVGGAVKKGEEKDLGVPVAGARGSGLGGAKPDRPSAIDRLNSVMDIGTTIAGGVDAFNKFSAPKFSGGGAFERRMGGPVIQRNRGY